MELLWSTWLPICLLQAYTNTVWENATPTINQN